MSLETERFIDARRITEKEMNLWMALDSSYGRALDGALDPHERELVRRAFREQLIGREVSWTSTVGFVVAWK